MEQHVGELTSFTLETTGDVVEDTALTDAAKSFIAGRTSFSGTLEMNFDETDWSATNINCWFIFLLFYYLKVIVQEMKVLQEQEL